LNQLQREFVYFKENVTFVCLIYTYLQRTARAKVNAGSKLFSAHAIVAVECLRPTKYSI